MARYKSFSHASREIHVSQPTLSRTIQELEQELGNPLFRRNYNSIELTEFGERFLEWTNLVLSEFHRLKAIAVEAAKDIYGKIYIGIPHITAVTSFATILAGFKNKYPKIKIVLMEQGPKQIERMLRQSLLDFGIFLPQNSVLYDWIWFDQDLHGLIMQQEHPLALLRMVNYKDLAKERLIIYNEDYLVHDQLLEGFQEKGLYPNIVFETSQLEMMLMLVKYGAGMAVMPRKLGKIIAADRSGYSYVPLDDPRLKMNLALVRQKQRTLSTASELFYRYLQGCLKKKGFAFNPQGIKNEL